MTAPDLPSHCLRVADLSASTPTRFDLHFEGPDRAVIATDLGLLKLRKLRFSGEIRAVNKHDWELEAILGATIVQPCVVTLEPVTTRIDMPVSHRFVANPPKLEESENGEVQMPDDETVEPLGTEIDVVAVMLEALSLNLPLYPRAQNADLGEAVFAEPGIVAMRDEDARPFAGLAGLRATLDQQDEKDDPDETS